jgi:threonine/homoserine/homoserine lactone efflux protein
MAIDSVAAFWAVSFLLVLVPGADWAYAIAAGLRDRSVIPAVSGLLAGYVMLTAVVAAGVAALVARTPVVLTVLTAAGGAYLIWLGVATLAKPASVPTADGSHPDGHTTWTRRTVKGAGISGLNPKALLLFIALLPQFTTGAADPSTPVWPAAAQIALLGLVHTANCGVVYLGVGTGARVVLRTRPAAARSVTRISGVTMIAIGATLLAERLTG